MPELSQHIAEFVHTYGIWAMFLSVMFESLGAPLPGESAIIITSTAAGRGEFNVYFVFLAATCASSLGNTIGYFIGRKTERETIVRIAAKLWLSEGLITKTETFMQKYGTYMVLFSRFVVGLRQLNGIVAGLTGMNFAAFQLVNITGAALWVGFWTTIAYKFGHAVNFVPYLWHHLNYIVAAGLLAMLAAFAWYYFKARPDAGT